MSNDGDMTQPTGAPAGTASPQALALHRNFCNAITGLKRELVRSIFYLRAIADRKVYRMLGYETIDDYAARVADLTAEQCRAFLRIGRKLEDLPAMRRALGDGSISWRKASFILGQATPATEADLVKMAMRLGEPALRVELRKTAGSLPAGGEAGETGDADSPLLPLGPLPAGPGPSANGATMPGSQAPAGIPRKAGPTARRGPRLSSRPPARPAEVLHVLFRFTAEQYALWQSFTHGARGQDKEEKLLAALTGGTGRGRSGYLIILQECPSCGQASHQTSRGSFAAPRALLETARCDATREDPTTLRRKRAIPPRLRSAVLRRDGYRCRNEGCNNTNYLQIHHRLPAAQGGRTCEDNLVTLCNRCHRHVHEEEEKLQIKNRGPET